MSEDQNQNTGTALALNSQEKIDRIVKEVQDEFLTSDEEVFKAGLRSLLVQEQKLVKQKAKITADIDADLQHLADARVALTNAFKTGELHSVEDARGVVRKVKRELEKDFASNIDIDDEFGA